jgi:hypothetical protein
MSKEGKEIRIALGGDLRVPAGGIVVKAPEVLEGARATINGNLELAGTDGEVVVRECPATIDIQP